MKKVPGVPIKCGFYDLGLPPTTDPQQVLLDAVGDLPNTSKGTRTLIKILHHYGRKTILMHWMGGVSPTMKKWRRQVNTVLPLYKLTFEKRGNMTKFTKIWEPWLTQEGLDVDYRNLI
ncbi:hypothetical protein XELAEV_18040007mg [Xenopus laevis]|uniref:Uncharacterized protein n=1 Tax=Xenopus laevis TaxID=8355 RepID=A0A974H8J0_XENLA|nr:hypothetical protein XELAEV_18040007mg [Xenopus laevis]